MVGKPLRLLKGNSCRRRWLGQLVRFGNSAGRRRPRRIQPFGVPLRLTGLARPGIVTCDGQLSRASRTVFRELCPKLPKYWLRSSAMAGYRSASGVLTAG